MFGNRMVLELVPGGFSDLMNQKNQNSNWKKVLGFRNLQEKLENAFDECAFVDLQHLDSMELSQYVFGPFCFTKNFPQNFTL